MTPGPWTQTTVADDPHRARWSQLKRTFALPAALAKARQDQVRTLAEGIHVARLEAGDVEATPGDVALAVEAVDFL